MDELKKTLRCPRRLCRSADVNAAFLWNEAECNTCGHIWTRRQRYGQRDSYKAKVYEAERLAFSGGDKRNMALWYANEKITEEQARQFVNDIVRSDFWRELTGTEWKITVEVVFKAIQGATAERWKINVGPTMERRWVLCHELAHIASYGAVDKVLGEAGHGWRWVRAYVAICDYVFGQHIATQLAEELEKTGVMRQEKV